METFDFVVLVVMQSKILHSINAVSNILQTKDIDLAKASLLLTNAQAELKIFRDDFDSVKQSAEELCR